MDPITIAAGSMAIGSLVQLYNSEKARGAEKARLDQIKSLYDSIKPPDYDLKITDPPELHAEKLKQPEFSDPAQAPKYNLDKLTPEQFKQIGQLTPQVAPYVAEEQPKLVGQTKDMQTGRQAQLDALKRFQSIGAGEFDPEYQQQVSQARRAAQTEAQSRQASILQDMARRGQSGSGMTLAAQLGGAAQSMDRNAMASQQAASDAYRNRLQAMSQGAQLGGQIQGEDTSLQSQNAGIINAFNQRMQANQQNWQNQRAGALNAANQFNLQAGQAIANQNVQQNNAMAQSQQRRQDDLAQLGFNNQLQNQNRQDRLAQWGYGNQVAQQAYGNQVAQQQYQNRVGQQQYQNNMLTQQYQNQLGKAGILAGVSNAQGQNAMGWAQDRNSSVQGLANMGAIYGMGQQQSNNAAAQQVSADNRAQYQQTGDWMSPDEMDKRRQQYGEYY